MENKPTIGSELKVAPAGQLPLEAEEGSLIPGPQPGSNNQSFMPNWMRVAGEVSLSLLAIAAGTAAEPAIDPSKAYGDYVQRIQPVRAHAANAGRHVKWIELDNAPYGYYLGQFNTVSDQATVMAVTKAKDYVYLAVRVRTGDSKPFWECGWARSGAVVEGSSRTSGFPPCAKRLGKLATDPFSVGHRFNCGPGECDDGTFETDQTPQCNGELDRNDKALDLATAGVPSRITSKIQHPLYDLIEKLDPAEPIHYRFTPWDNKTVVVRSGKTWGLMSSNCVAGMPQGGPPKTQDSFLNQETAGVVGQLGAEQVFAKDGVNLAG